MAKLIKAMLDNSISVTVINSTDIVEEARLIHGFSPVVTVAMGRMLTIASMLGTTLKNETDDMTLSVNGGGEMGQLQVCTKSSGNVKGWVNNPDCPTHYRADGKPDVSRSVGNNGRLVIIKDMGLKEPYVSGCPLLSGEISDDFTNYFITSEQVITMITAGVLLREDGSCDNAAGMYVSVLPFCEKEVTDKLACCFERPMPIDEEASYDGKGLIERMFADFEIEYVLETETEYACDCSYERVSRAVKSIGYEECMRIIEEEGAITAHCEFCERDYRFDKDAISELFAEGPMN